MTGCSFTTLIMEEWVWLVFHMDFCTLISFLLLYMCQQSVLAFWLCKTMYDNSMYGELVFYLEGTFFVCWILTFVSLRKRLYVRQSSTSKYSGLLSHVIFVNYRLWLSKSFYTSTTQFCLRSWHSARNFFVQSFLFSILIYKKWLLVFGMDAWHRNSWHV